jgi:ABC-type multidrug transport system ATPase subunit
LLENTFNQLDETDKERFLDHLLESKASVLAISNDPLVAKRFNRVVVMNKGTIVAEDKLEQLEKNSWFTDVFQKTKLYA